MKKNIVLKVRELICEPISALGYILWDLEYKKEGASYNLIVTIDKPEGEVDIDDCVKVNNLIDPLLDQADPIDDSYCLEVSSAGLERELKEKLHFEKYKGKLIEVKLFAPLDGKKSFCALLLDFDGENLTLELDGKKLTLELKRCALVKNYVDYAAIMKEKA